MRPELKIALAMLFSFCVGMTLIFYGAGGGKLAAFFAGAALVLFATRILVALFQK